MDLDQKGSEVEKFLTMSKIVHLADAFARTVEEKQIAPVMALREILSDEKSPALYNSKVLEALAKVFIDPDKIIKEN